MVCLVVPLLFLLNQTDFQRFETAVHRLQIFPQGLQLQCQASVAVQQRHDVPLQHTHGRRIGLVLLLLLLRRSKVPGRRTQWRSLCDAAAAAAAASFEFKKPVQKFLRRPHQGTNVAEQVFQSFLLAVQLVVQLHQFRVTVVRWRLLKGGEVEEVKWKKWGISKKNTAMAIQR